MTAAYPASAEGAKLWDVEHHEHDMLSTRLLGFWLYMLGDSLIFAALFAAYGVLSFPNSSAGGPTAHDVVHPLGAFWQTLCLFTSVFAYGLAMVQLRFGRAIPVIAAIGVALVLGLAFLVLEGVDIGDLFSRGITPERSGYLSAFFTLIIVHGIHMAIGVLWMLVMMVQVARSGLTPKVTYRLANLKVFWLYQALVWTFVFCFVYLRGAI